MQPPQIALRFKSLSFSSPVLLLFFLSMVYFSCCYVLLASLIENSVLHPDFIAVFCFPPGYSWTGYSF